MNDEKPFAVLCTVLHALNEPVDTPFVQWRDSDMHFDRFDARHLLDALPAPRSQNDATEPPQVAALLNPQRHLSINGDDDDNVDDDDDTVPNDRKRAAIPFTYAPSKKAKKKSEETLQLEFDAERSRVPAEIEIPRDHVRRAVIQRTALFVREQGDRAEVALKIRESDNIKFSFLLHTHPDFTYYSWLKRNGVVRAETLVLIEKTCAHAAKLDVDSASHERGNAFLDTLRAQKADNADFRFLWQGDANHALFVSSLERARQAIKS
jgi:hypothetical protein